MKDDTVTLDLVRAGPATERPISIAIVAMGGQGGGVLTEWIVQLAESQNWVAQSTSVPGVAQRTGATIYYVEMMPADERGRKPILAQMPTPGDVDIVLASEMMEAGRSIMRGLVTPERTTLIGSSHRALAIAEKMAPGEGIGDSGSVVEAIGVTAKTKIVFDMNALAASNGSVISAAMFGSLAKSGALPFAREAYHEVIRRGGKGVEASLKTFEAAYTYDPESAARSSPVAPAKNTEEVPVSLADPAADALLQRLRQDLPVQAHRMAYLGLVKVVDFQDPAYGGEYLDLLRAAYARDREVGGESRDFAYTVRAAKYLARAMAYDDIIRVAALKTRSERRRRIENEVGFGRDQVLQTTEFFHPRMEEFVSILPKGLADGIIARPGLYRWLDRRVNKGRRLRTYSLPAFLMLYTVGGMTFLRRRSMRHVVETEHRDAWLSAAHRAIGQNYELGVEILGFQRLIKGYSDTHARGRSKFDKVMTTALSIADRPDAADWARRLMSSAVKDASSDELDGTIKTIESFR